MQLQFHLFVAHFRKLGRGPDQLVRTLQQACVFSDRYRGFAAVTGDHNDLYACILNFSNRFDRFGTDFIANTQNTYQRQSVCRKLIAFDIAFIGAECQHSDRICCQFQHSVIQCFFHFFGQRLAVAFRIPVVAGLQNQLFRSAFSQAVTLAVTADCRPRIFIGAVERNKFITVQHFFHTVATYIVAERPLSHIAADHSAVRNGCRGIEHNVLVSKGLQLCRQYVKLRVFLTVTGNEPYDFQLALCDRACLIGKKQVQTARSFNTDQLPHKYVIAQHFFHIQRRNDRDHQRQPFRHRHNDNDDTQNNSLHQIRQQKRRISKISAEIAVQIGFMQHDCQSDQHTAGITKLADMMRQSLKF